MGDLFADMLGNVVVTGALIRLEFMRLAKADPDSKQATFELSHRMVMPLDGFLKSLALQESVRAKLVADGIVKREPRPGAKDVRD